MEQFSRANSKTTFSLSRGPSSHYNRMNISSEQISDKSKLASIYKVSEGSDPNSQAHAFSVCEQVHKVDDEVSNQKKSTYMLQKNVLEEHDDEKTVNEESNEKEVINEFCAIPTQVDENIGLVASNYHEELDDVDNNLPETAVLLKTEKGSKVYLVGTVHFSVESQNDVARVIRAVHPDYLILELCPSRSYMLQWNEEQIFKEAQNMNFKVMRQIFQSTGLVQGGLYLLLLSMTVQITKQLGIAPGGEFRAAYREAKNIPNCIILFGDRPIHITLQRMLASLSVWQIIKLAFVALFKDEKISKEEVEKCKDRDVLERMLLGFSRELPDFAKVMVSERDSYLTYTLQLAASQGQKPNKVVGVVGIGHLAGIQEQWGRVSPSRVQEISSIPPPNRSSKILKYTLKLSAVGLILYGVHKIASKSEYYSNLFRLLRDIAIEITSAISFTRLKCSLTPTLSQVFARRAATLLGESTETKRFKI